MPGIIKYSVVETALAETYRTPSAAIESFRAKLRFLQKRGLNGPLPGRGVALHYDADRMYQLIFACEAFAFGFTPSVVLELVNARWERRLRGIFTKAEKARAALPEPGADDDIGQDIIMHMGGVDLLRDAWEQRVPNVNAHELRQMAYYTQAWLGMLPDDTSGLPPRMLATNLTMRLRVFHDALARTNLRAKRDGESKPAPVARKRGKGRPRKGK